ncbi:MAG: hypothetical protein PUD02_03850, partial [Eggerthellales bacterium]|nr:hypothetical protein [Eggerthellales bacterium]
MLLRGGELICAEAESLGHQHLPDCYDDAGNLTCLMAESEGHAHGADCYCPGGELTCTLGEGPAAEAPTADPEGPGAPDAAPAAGSEEGGPATLESATVQAPTLRGAPRPSSRVSDEAELREAIASSQAGGTIVLESDISVDTVANGPIQIDSSVGIDFNGHSISTPGGSFNISLGDKSVLFNVSASGSLDLYGAQVSMGAYRTNYTFTGSVVGENKGSVTVHSTSGEGVSAGNVVDYNDGAFRVVDGLFQTEGDIVDSSRTGSTITVDGGTFISEEAFVDSAEGATIVVNGGTFDSGYYCFDDLRDSTITVYDAKVVSEDSCIYVSTGGETRITIHGGTFESLDYSVVSNYQSSADEPTFLTIYGGEFITHNDNHVIYNEGTAEIHGGTFKALHDTSDYPDGSAIFNDGEYGSGVAVLYGGTFMTANGQPAFTSEDGGVTRIAEGYRADPAEWEGADLVRVLPVTITVDFYVDGEAYDQKSGAPWDIVFPEDPADRDGYPFLYWEDSTGAMVSDLGALIEDARLDAVFSDRTYTVTFDAGSTTWEEPVVAGTPLGQVPGLDWEDADGLIYGWTLDGQEVGQDSDIPVTRDMTLVAAYTVQVSTYDELVDALAEKRPYIKLAQDIPVEDVLVVDYECTMISDGFGLIRPDDYLGVLLTTQAGVAGGDDVSGIEGEGASLILNGVLVDGRNIEATDPAVLVGPHTSMTLNGATIRNNINTDSWYYTLQGGGVCNMGVLTMNEGTLIQGNTAECGGGVANADPSRSYRDDLGTFEDMGDVVFYMFGGSILSNTALDSSSSCNSAGGGVNVDGRWSSHSSFYMYGGVISGNSAPNGCGGGVTLCCGDQEVTGPNADVVFTMYGGEITDNYAGIDGGGVWVACSSFAMEGGLISRNTAAETGGGIAGCCA